MMHHTSFLAPWPIVTTRKLCRQSGTSLIIVRVGETVVGKMGVGEMALTKCSTPSLLIITLTTWAVRQRSHASIVHGNLQPPTVFVSLTTPKNCIFVGCMDRFNDISSQEIWLL